METLEFLMMGFASLATPENLMYAFLGSVLGTLVGVLPGVGPAAGTAILIPVTFVLPPTGAIIMLAAIYYGAMYGGTITSVLINTPGEAASVVTCIEGYEMARRGRAGAALSIAAIGSFIGGTIATICLVIVALPLSRMALKFGPPEFFALMCVGLSLVMGLAGKSVSKALLSGLLGLALSQVGMEPMMGRPRFDFGITDLMSGVELIAIVMGLFGVGEILTSAESPGRRIIDSHINSLMPTVEDWKRCVPAIIRGTGVGTLIGVIPGIGSAVPAFISFVVEKKIISNPKERWGNGVIEGVAGPETANNAYANAALIPLFTLGVPGSPTIAILMGAFMMNGLIPGPFLFKEHPEVVWTVIASLYLGNVILLILNLPLIRLWVKVISIPTSILWPLILGFCVVGSYSLNNRIWDVGVMLLFGLVGYGLRKLDYPLAPMVLTLVLGPLMEKGIAQSLTLSRGDPSIFFTRPLSLALLILAALFLLSSSVRMLPFGTSAVRQDTEV